MQSAYQRAPNEDLDAPVVPFAPPHTTAPGSYVTAMTTPHPASHPNAYSAPQPATDARPAGFVQPTEAQQHEMFTAQHHPQAANPPPAWKSFWRRKASPTQELPFTAPPPGPYPQTSGLPTGGYPTRSGQELPYGYVQHAPHASATTLYEPYSANGYNDPMSWTMPGSMPGANYLRPGRPTLEKEGHRPLGWDPRLLEEGEEDPDTWRTHGIPTRLMHQGATKRVELWRGNLVMDCPVPSHLLNVLPDGYMRDREHMYMRYTACTADPNNFGRDQYRLRPSLFDPPRHIELMICLTMYNEDDVLFANTLHAVMENIAYLPSEKADWPHHAWKHVVVVIVSDGRRKVHPRTLAVLAAMGVYQEGITQTEVKEKPVTAHIYEYSAQFSIDAEHNIHFQRQQTSVQIVFCLKEQNQKKINSHRWFFNAFCHELNPEVTVLIDVGTVPRPKAIYRLWKAFKSDSSVAGACGEIVASKGKLYHDLVNPLVGAQNFEYKISNILDKPLESVFGYITVLPGAFSAYRYKALVNDMGGNGPLAEYFKGELLHGGTGRSDIFTSNMYLAEDRILCWEIVTKRNSRWKLHYVKRSQAVTDVPETVPELMGQRRRWLNGSTFAGVHSIVKFYYIYRSSHSWLRKLALHLELIYQLVNLLFAWLSLGNYFVCFWIITKAVSQAVHAMRIPSIILTVLYLMALVMTVILAIGNRPAGSRRAYTRLMIAFGIFTTYMTACAVILAVFSIRQVLKNARGPNKGLQLIENPVFRNIVISVASTYGCWLIASVIWLEPWHMVTSSIQYIIMSPTWVNIFSTYAYSNIHDVSWGTKGEAGAGGGAKPKPPGAEAEKPEVNVSMPSDDNDVNGLYDDAWELLRTHPQAEKKVVNPAAKAKDYYATVRSNVLLAWIMSNGGLAVGICVISDIRVQILYMGVLLYSAAAIAAIKLMGTIIYLIEFLIKG